MLIKLILIGVAFSGLLGGSITALIKRWGN